MSQPLTSPFDMLRHRMSSLPSAFRSPADSMRQLSAMPGCTTAVDCTDAPATSQPDTAPVEVLRHIRSSSPSPSKSPVAATRHSAVTAEAPPNAVSDVSTSPFISHARIAPSSVRHRRSDRPSPSTSARPM